MHRILISLAIALMAAVSAAPVASAMGMDPHECCGGSDAKDLLSLADLADGDSFSSSNGAFVFSDFEVIVSGSLNPALGFYKVITLDDGFAISGPITAANGNSGGLSIQYTITSASPITGAELEFDGVASGKGSSASVVETYDQPMDVELSVFATGEGGLQRLDSLDLEGFTTLRVTKDILVDANNAGDWVAIFCIEQRFSAPEPAAMLLIGSSLLLVVAARRR